MSRDAGPGDALPGAGALIPAAVAAVGLLGAWSAIAGVASLSGAEAIRLAVFMEPARVVGNAAREARPPGYELVLAAWATAFGQPELGLRSLSLAWTLLTVIATAGIARWLVSPWAAALAPLALVASPLVITEAVELGPYAQAAALGATATWLFLRPSPGLGGWVAYAALGSAAVWTHPGAAAVLVGHGISAAVGHRAGRLRLRSWGIAACTAVSLLTLWGVALLAGPPTQSTIVAVESLRDTVPPLWAIPAGGAAALIVIGIATSRTQDSTPLGRAALVLLPLGLLVGIGLVGTEIDANALVLAMPTVACSLAAGLSWIGRVLTGNVASAAGKTSWKDPVRVGVPLVAVALLAGGGWFELAQAQAGRANYRELVRHILLDARERDLVVLAVPGQFAAVEYYSRGRIPIIELPFAPAFVEGSGETVLSSLVGVGRGLWIVTAAGSHDPEGQLPGWLAGRLYPVADYPYGRVELRLYLSEPDMRSGQGRSVFGGVVELPEAAVPAGAVGRDLPVAVRLHWRAREAIASRLVVVVELVGDGRVLARREAEPAGGTRPTTTWEAGETIVDRIALRIPEKVLTGSYTVRVILYEAVTRSRLRLADGREMLDIGTVRIGPATRNPL